MLTLQPQLQCRDLLSLADLSSDEFHQLIDHALELRQLQQTGKAHDLLARKSLALVFEKPSLRTRSTFDLAMYQLGGRAVYLSQQEIRLGERESVKDVAHNLERWFDGIVARTFAHATVKELAEHADIPVVNGLSDLVHPCQILADYAALKAHFGDYRGLKLVFVGDGNNVVHSHIYAAVHSGIELCIACPETFMPDPNILAWATGRGANISISHDPKEAICNANALYTDVWISMGQEEEAVARKEAFAGYTITPEWFEALASDGVFMHDLPAHYGEECSEECIYHERSIVFEQAEFRLHSSKAVLANLIPG